MEKANERLRTICFLTAGKNFETARAKCAFRTAPPSVKITDESKDPGAILENIRADHFQRRN